MQRSLVLNSSGVLQEADIDENLIINGTFDINQIGATSYPVNTSSVNLFSQWVGGRSGTAAYTVTNGDPPTANQVGGYQGNSLLVTTTTAQSVIGNLEWGLVFQRIEGYEFRKIVGRPFTISFWVRSSKIGIHCVSIRNTDATQSFVGSYQIFTANTWERKVITVPAPPVGSGQWNYINGTAFSIQWTLFAGAGFVTPQPNTWQAGNYLSVSGSANVCDAVNSTFQLALVKLEPGAIATPFKHLDYQTQLRRCERYYARMAISFYRNCTTPDTLYYQITLPIWMRTTPTAALVTAVNRTNLSTSSSPIMVFYNPREGYFYMAAAAAGYYGVFSDIWELNARL